MTIKYSSAGVPLWTNHCNGPKTGNDNVSHVAVDHSGNLIVTGYSSVTGPSTNYAIIKYTFPLVVTGFKQTTDSFEMVMDNCQPGPLLIEGSTNLADWSPLFTNTEPTNVLFYTDPEASNYPVRFYRAFQYP